LVLAWCEACGGDLQKALPLALAIEYIHTASLIHDDLPCMDNAMTRRGKECLHLAFDEATAVLAGDALLNLAITIIINSDLSIEQKNNVFTVMSNINNELCLGQLLEMSELPHITDTNERIEKLLQIHEYKTAGLIKGACMMGIVAAERYDKINHAIQFGYNAGMWYQLLDDIYDGDGLSLLLTQQQIDDSITQYKQNCLLVNHEIKSNFLNDII
jgi:geranylgeranyl diphosphate synthase type II